MTATIQTLLLLLAVLVVVAIVARRLNTAPSILLVIAGVGLALAPGLPRIELAPELVLLGILPPLIYSAGVAMSWREFRFNLRPITLLAFGCVVFTTCAVAAAAHWLLGMPLAVAFVLGAIVAPPDVVAPLAIARRLGLPRRLLVVLEGEGLANDATALILYRFAVAAVSTGLFSFGQAAGTFALIVVGEIAYGIGIGWLSLRLRRWARDPRVEITLSLMTPYVAFWVPEHLGGSGVLATIAAGLFVSWNGPLLIPAATRLQGIFFWDLVVYLLEGFVFLVTGLQARTLLDRIDAVQLRDLVARRAAHGGGGDRRTIHLGVSGHLSAALAEPVARTPGSISALAVGLPSCVRRRARRRLARGGAGHSADHRSRARRFRTAISFSSSPSASSSSRWSARDLLLPSVVRWLGLARHSRGRASSASTRPSWPHGRMRSLWRRTGWNSSRPMAEFRPRCWRFCVPGTSIASGGCREIRRTGSTPLP